MVQIIINLFPNSPNTYLVRHHVETVFFQSEREVVHVVELLILGCYKPLIFRNLRPQTQLHHGFICANVDHDKFVFCINSWKVLSVRIVQTFQTFAEQILCNVYNLFYCSKAIVEIPSLKKIGVYWFPNFCGLLWNYKRHCRWYNGFQHLFDRFSIPEMTDSNNN